MATPTTIAFPIQSAPSAAVPRASITGGAATLGVFRTDRSGTAAIGADSTPLPTGGTMTFLLHDPAVNERGQVAFTTEINNMTAFGVFPGDGASTTKIALQGTAAPGTNGGTFAGFVDPAMDEDGRVAFIATLTPGVGDTDASNSVGIWMGTSEADLHLVARAGQLIGGNTLVDIPQIAGQLELVEKAVAWIDSFSARARAIIVSDIDDDDRR
jgi:hypothetical protein